MKLQPGTRPYHYVFLVLHLIVLALSVYLVITISLDTFRDVNFYSPGFLRTQFYICMAFIADFFVELMLSPHRWRFFRNNVVFLIFSIPYLEIFNLLDVTFTPMAAYLVQFIPLVRGGYALAIVVGWFTYNRAASIFVTYLVTLLATVYFGSLIFFLFEHKINHEVQTYGDALWWALMDMSTVGSNINPMSYVGKVLAVVLAALGMMMFPIFTVYITSIITQRRSKPLPGIPGRRADVAQPGGASTRSDAPQKE